MRLKQLEMRNFGPYRNETVDFEALASAQLFLISGKTGSGKTTIFDALVYALYGTTTGGERSGSEMRANFATPKEKTEVQLTFSHNGADYLIYRAPEQQLAKQRGDGLTNASAKVSLKIMQAGQEVGELTKMQAVRERIQDLLQLDADQFRQMVLLPQGKFRQFLDAKSDEKEKLLRHLFNTGLYARWQTALQAEAKQQAQAIEKQQNELETLAKQFDYGAEQPDSQASLADRLALMQAVIASQAEAVTGLSQQAQATKSAATQADNAYHQADKLQAAFGAKDQAQASLTALTARQPQQDAAIKRLADLRWAHEWSAVAAQVTETQHQKQALTAAKQQTAAAGAEAQQALEAAQATQGALKAQAPQIEVAKTRQQQLISWQEQLAVVAAAEQADRIAQANQAKAQAQLRDQQVEMAAAAKALAAIQAKQVALAEDDQSAALQAAETLAARLNELEQQLTQVQRRQAASSREAQALAGELPAKKQAAQAAQEHYRGLHDRSLRNQIATLVAQLTPGSPCPVCGSQTHPKPADAHLQAAVAPDELQAADDQRSAAQEALTALLAKIEQHQDQDQRLEHDHQAIEAQIQEAAGQAAQPTAAQTLTAHAQRRQALQVAVDVAQKQAQTLEAEARRLAQRQEQLAVYQQQLSNQQHASQIASAEAAAKLAAAREKLPEDIGEAATIEAERRQLQTQGEHYQQALEQNQAQLQTARDRVTRLQTQLQDQTSQLQDLTRQLTVKTQTLTAALADHATDQATFTSWLAAETEMPRLAQQVADFDQEKARQQALLAKAEEQIAGRAKPDLERLAVAHQQADAAADAAQRAWLQADQALTQATGLHSQIQAGYQRNQAALNSGLALQDLAAVVNGNNAQKLSLERYVLRAYLQQVLVVANQRLKGLSDGRYQLLLHQAPGSYRNDSGLEIDVYDDQVGETRSVHTLSGGESFIAALALALALGEVIQQAAGGITIDALFIDEGFGSLDSASLDTALAALSAIEGQSRLIGIISHVESLRDGIATQLRVTPSGAGDSHIRLIHLDA